MAALETFRCPLPVYANAFEENRIICKEMAALETFRCPLPVYANAFEENKICKEMTALEAFRCSLPVYANAFEENKIICKEMTALEAFRCPLPVYFFLSGFSLRTLTNHWTSGEGGRHFFNSSLPLPPASQTLRN